MAKEARGFYHRPLDPIDRVSEVLFGLIMALVSTSTLSVFTAGRAEVRTMIIGAVGCNLAWGIIDAGMYLMACLDERGRNILTLRAIRHAASRDEARRVIADALPEYLATALSDDELDSIRRKLSLPESSTRPSLTKEDVLGALAVGLLVFLSTFPVVIPFLFTDSALPALRISNVIAILLLFLCGYAFARSTGLRPWWTGFVMVAIGSALVGIAIALGG